MYHICDTYRKELENMEIKTVDELMKALILIQECEENVSGDTELIFFADNGDGTACMMDKIELGLNGNFVQLFMRREDDDV